MGKQLWRDLPATLKVLLASTILANIAGAMLRPFLALYILALGGTVRDVGLFFTIDVLALAILRPLGGWFSDQFGRLPSVGFGGLFSFGGAVVMALAPGWGWLLVGQLVVAVGRGLVGPSFQAFIAEVAPAGQLGRTFGLVNGLFTACQIIGPPLGGYLVAAAGYGSLLWLGAAIGLVAAALRLLAARGAAPQWGQVQGRLLLDSLRGLGVGLTAGGLLTWLFLTDALRDVGIKLYENLQSPLFELGGLGEGQIGWLFSFYAVIYMLVNFVGGQLADRWGATVALVLSGLLQAIALFVLASSPTIPIFYLFFSLAALSFGLGDPAFDSFLARAAPAGSLGLTFGLFSSAISILSTPMPYLGGWLWEAYRPVTPFWLGGLVLILAALVTWRYLGRAVRETTFQL
ncbi:MAG: MFS transporter [Anaerolineales bacterium]|nr:MFS transporter [Anaerolineales bacterium]MCB0004831.1 MFS transporter [Anaerolineales bacterium]MCB8959519.1 MFS transporter [Ardenticatenales bacterium]